MAYEPYGGKPPFVSESDTSRAAAESVQESAGTIRAKVLAEIMRRSITCDQAEMALNLSHQTASARIRELYLKGLIRDSGERRLTRSGRKAVVWQVSAGSSA